jgi:hypothetical protein
MEHCWGQSPMNPSNVAAVSVGAGAGGLV